MRIVKAFFSIFAALFLIIPVLRQNAEHLPADIEAQKAHIAALETAYANGEIAPVDEAAFFDGDLQAVLDSGIHFDKLSFLGTHNSYETRSVPAYIQFCNAVSNLAPTLLPAGTGTLDQEPLTDQLNSGIRSFELDVEAAKSDDGTVFRCMHNPPMTMTTNCYDFALALQEIVMWSDNNPGHLPITILIEPKKMVLPMGSLRDFRIAQAKEMDKCLRENLGDKLFTPADMLRGYESFAQMRQADDWCEAKELLGKVLVLLHQKNSVTKDYIALDPTIRTQTMFPMLRMKDMQQDCASFILENDPKKVLSVKDDAKQAHVIVRTRVDVHPLYSAERLEQAFACGAQIQSTDFPLRKTMSADEYYVAFPGNKTVRIAK